MLLISTTAAHTTMEVSGNSHGSGYYESSIEAAGQLIEFTHDSHTTVEDWSFLLVTHGYQVDRIGFLNMNGTIYEIEQNGTLRAI